MVGLDRGRRAPSFAALLMLWALLSGFCPAQAVSESPYNLTTATGTIRGTLTLPKAAGALPRSVALIIAGSGPTDRDGNSPLLFGSNDSLKMLAHGLARNGIASLRYDKRGVAASRDAAVSEADLRFDTYVDDARQWLRRLRADGRFGKIVVIGHSEGSLVGMVAAQNGEAQAFVSLAGAGQSADVLLRKQFQAQGLLSDRIEEILRGLSEGRSQEVLEADLRLFFRPSVQPYMISWFRHDPGREIARLKIPVLIVQGSTDLQVGPEQADILAQAGPGAMTLRLAGMNHVLKRAPAERMANLAAYSDPRLPLAPMLLQGLHKFIARL